jgi:hypothetical protein
MVVAAEVDSTAVAAAMAVVDTGNSSGVDQNEAAAGSTLQPLRYFKYLISNKS